jgi:hypothetical protein
VGSVVSFFPSQERKDAPKAKPTIPINRYSIYSFFIVSVTTKVGLCRYCILFFVEMVLF